MLIDVFASTMGSYQAELLLQNAAQDGNEPVILLVFQMKKLLYSLNGDGNNFLAKNRAKILWSDALLLSVFY